MTNATKNVAGRNEKEEGFVKYYQKTAMKQLTFYGIALAFLAGAAFSCSKHHNDPNDPNAVQVTVKSGETYQKDMGRTAIEEGMRISRQAEHFSVSKLAQDSAIHWIYTYKPAEGFTGTDEVKLTRDISPGGIPTDSVITHFIFSVTR